ncbi:hypothetical protein D3C75_520130 [compost metagenome]|jgi:antitoxin component of MazEF toxin-antitoxin module
MKIMIEEWDGDGAIRIPDEALQELELDVGDAVYLIEEFVGNTRCLIRSKTPQIADRTDELTEAWDSLVTRRRNETAVMRFLDDLKEGHLQLLMGESCLDQACVRYGSAHVFYGALNCVICRRCFTDEFKS